MKHIVSSHTILQKYPIDFQASVAFPSISANFIKLKELLIRLGLLITVSYLGTAIGSVIYNSGNLSSTQFKSLIDPLAPIAALTMGGLLFEHNFVWPYIGIAIIILVSLLYLFHSKCPRWVCILPCFCFALMTYLTLLVFRTGG